MLYYNLKLLNRVECLHQIKELKKDLIWCNKVIKLNQKRFGKEKMRLKSDYAN